MQTIARTLLKNFHKKKSSTWEGTNHENENERVEEGWMAWPWWWWVEAKAESESKRVSVKWVVGLMGKWRILRISAPKSFIAESPTWEMPQMEASQLLRTQKVSWDGETSQQATTQPTTMVTNLLTCQNKKRKKLKSKYLIAWRYIYTKLLPQAHAMEP